MNKSKKVWLIPFGATMLTMVLASCGGTPSSTSSGAQSASSSSESGSASGSSSSVASSSESSSVAPVVYDEAQMYKNGEDFSGITKSGVTGGASGVYSYVDATTEERTNILGNLEKYAVDNEIAGLPLYENGGYVMYNPRVVKGFQNYIIGYGFGIIREGSLNGSLTGPTGKTKPTYYHNWEASDPGSINALDTDGSQIADLYGNIASGYFGNKANATGTAYDWYGTLAKKDRPYLVTIDASGNRTAAPAASASAVSNTWRVYLRTGTGDDAVYFRTGSGIANRKAYDKKAVTLDDYVNAWKILTCGKFAYYRGSELIAKTGKNGIAGLAKYYNDSKDGLDSAKAKAAWDASGIKSGTDSVGDYLDFTFLAPTNRFYAMYTLAESNYAPINREFFDLVTDKGANPRNYGGYNSDKSATPVDNILSTGSYYLESWEDSKSISFAKNDTWKEFDWSAATPKEYTGIYSIAGIYTSILTGYNTDEAAAFKEFLAGNLDSAGIPTDYLDGFKADARSVQVPGDSVFKLNVNSTTQEKWNSLFGKNGSVAHGEDNGYLVKPWMSNSAFVKGLFFSIDRATFAAKKGRVPSTNYFSTNYLSDPENGISYDSTTQHAAAVKDFWGTSIATSGYDVNLASTAFDSAVTALLAAGSVKDNQVLSINIWWMYQSMIESYGKEIGGYMETAFNASSVAKAHGVTLKVDNEAVSVWSDVYYKHLMVGQFDLGFGSISGNALDPLNFMEVLKSNNSSGFTLNWGPDTAATDLDYNGQKWSFDNLWGAADHGICTYKGEEIAVGGFTLDDKFTFDADKNLTVTGTYSTVVPYLESIKDTDADAKAVLDGMTANGYSVGLDAFYVTDQSAAYVDIRDDGTGTLVPDSELVTVNSWDAATGKISLTISQELLGAFGDKSGYFFVGTDTHTSCKGVSGLQSTQAIVLLGSSTAA